MKDAHRALDFDTIELGVGYPLGSHVMERSEIVDFAGKYDPQPWHLDDEAAQAHPLFGRLSASGWHTTMVLNMLMDRFVKQTALRPLAGGGVEGVRWAAPVFVDDTLTGELQMISRRVSESKPDRGIATMRGTLANQDGVQVITCDVTGIFRVAD